MKYTITVTEFRRVEESEKEIGILILNDKESIVIDLKGEKVESCVYNLAMQKGCFQIENEE